MNHSIRSQGGFTLVEIMIVVVIISLLAALAIPAWTSVRTKSLLSRMDSDIRLIGHSAQQYAFEYGVTVVPFGYDSVTGELSGPLSRYVDFVNRGYVFNPANNWDSSSDRVVEQSAIAVSCRYDGSGHRIP